MYAISHSNLGREINRVFRFRYVVYSYVYTTLKIRYRRSYLGFFWTMLAPLIQYLMIGVIMGMLVGSKIPNYYRYYFSGALFFSLINGVIGKSPLIMIGNEHYIKKTFVPKTIFILNVVCYEFANFFLSALGLVVFGAMFGAVELHPTIPLSILALGFALVFLLGIASFISVATVYFRDFDYIIPVAMQALFFVTPITYDMSMIPEKRAWIITYNPFYYFVEIFRQPLLGQVPSWNFYGIVAATSLVTCFLGLWCLRHFENKIVFKL